MFSFRRKTHLVPGFTVCAILALVLITLGVRSDSQDEQPVDVTAVRPEEWASLWDPEVGLWWQDHPGHTRPARDEPRTHPAPSAAARLLLAAQAGQLQKVDVSAVLGAIRQMQTLNGGGKGHGELRWYWEERGPVDHNGSFFAGMSLIALHYGHADQLTPGQRAALNRIFVDLRVWFTSQANEREFFYPNRYLGDVVGAWLLGEITEPCTGQEALRRTMLDAAAYWADDDWGWGEHLSDTYSGICLDELSALLLFSERLPADVRGAYTSLFHELLAIDDAFGNEPRVPAIRTYAFGRPPTRIQYRDTIRPLAKPRAALPHPAMPPMPPELGGVFRHRPPLGATLHQFGWHGMAPPPPPPAPRADLTVPLYGDAVATARIERDIRIGSISRYPIMPEADQPKWGMSWQTTPVAFHRQQGDWGFLQWESREGDRARAHPAHDLLSGYADNALASDDAVSAVGQTFSVQRGGDLIVVRWMPNAPAAWDSLTDQIRIVNAQTLPETGPDANANGRHGLTLRYPRRTVGIECLPISPGATVELLESSAPSGARLFDWGARFDRDALDMGDGVIVVWGISINGAIAAAPLVLPATGEQDPEAFDLHWDWPGTKWRLRVNVGGDRPIEDLTKPLSTAVRPGYGTTGIRGTPHD